MGEHTLLDELPAGAFLFAARRKDRPNSGRPPASPFGAGALSDLAVNDDSPNGLLG